MDSLIINGPEGIGVDQSGSQSVHILTKKASSEWHQYIAITVYYSDSILSSSDLSNHL